MKIFIGCIKKIVCSVLTKMMFSVNFSLISTFHLINNDIHVFPRVDLLDMLYMSDTSKIIFHGPLKVSELCDKLTGKYFNRNM